QKIIDKTDIGKLKLEPVKTLTYQEGRKEIQQEADRKLVDQVMTKDDKIILFLSKNPPAQRYMLMRKQAAGWKVVGGPFKLTYLIQHNSASPEMWKFMEAAGPFDVLSLDAKPQKEKPLLDFHGAPVLGKTTVNDAATRKKLISALKQAVEDSDGASIPGFHPRHGIRIVFQKTTLDFLLCFERLQAHVYKDDKKLGELRLTSEPQPIFDAVLKAANVPLTAPTEK